MYFSIRNRFPNRKLHIEKYVQAVEKRLGYPLTYRLAYSQQIPSLCRNFLARLIENKFQVFFGKPYWYTEMALHIADMLPKFDCLVAGSTAADVHTILRWVDSKGKLVEVFACNVPRDWPWSRSEIREDLLHETIATRE